MAPGQILIEFVIPIVSVAATIVGALIVKKRRDRRKAKACETIDVDANLDEHQHRIKVLENAVNTLTHSVLVCATEEKVEGQIREANDRLRLDISQWDENKASKSEMERHVDEGCSSVLRSLRAEMLDTAKSDVEVEVEVEVDMTDVRKEINKKLTEYDLAITKWIGKKLEDYQTTLQASFAAAQHDVQDEAMCEKCDDVEDEDEDDDIDL